MIKTSAMLMDELKNYANPILKLHVEPLAGQAGASCRIIHTAATPRLQAVG